MIERRGESRLQRVAAVLSILADGVIVVVRWAAGFRRLAAPDRVGLCLDPNRRRRCFLARVVDPAVAEVI